MNSTNCFSDSVRARRRRAVSLAFAAALAVAPTGPARADSVTDWNATADSFMPTLGPPPFRNRVMAMVQIAVHDALNSIDARYEPYATIPTANAGASPDAAVATATYEVLKGTLAAGPAGQVFIQYSAYMAGLGCPSAYPQCKDDGAAVGRAAADAILALRLGDGSATPHLPYTTPPGLGVYQPTPPQNAAPQFEGWGKMRPFIMNSPSQFRMGPSDIFDLTGETYTRDFVEVKRVGSSAATPQERTTEQSEIARYWPNGGANGHAVARAIVKTRNLDRWQHARLFALVGVALNDSTIAVFDTKYTYRFWRPTTAIRAADSDGNPATVADPNWTSYQPTPPYPDYTCGLTNNTGSFTEVLRRYFATDELPYTLTAAGLTRNFTTLKQAEREAVDARVFGGMHFRTGCRLGIIQGNKVGRFAIQHYLRPLERGRGNDE